MCGIKQNAVTVILYPFIWHFPSDHKSWSMARSSNFSYSDKPKFGGGIYASSSDTQPDDFLDSGNSPNTGHEINDMVHKKNLLNSKLRMAGGRTLITPLNNLQSFVNVNNIFLWL